MSEQQWPPLPAGAIGVAALAAVMGVMDCCDVYPDFQRHQISINLGVLFLPAGGWHGHRSG